MENIPHIPVLYREVLDTFSGCHNAIVDCTMGYGGHTSMLLESVDSRSVIGLDQDITAIEFSRKRLEIFGKRATIKQGRFSELISSTLAENSDICGVLADIGVSSLQLDERDRGFSFESESLDMRMDRDRELSAMDVINSYDKKSLQDILYNYGEIKNSAKIADAIVKSRPFNSTKELLDAIIHLLPRNKKIHPATLVLQAIRIEVNDELGELERLLESIEKSEAKKLTVAIISFHSLEDRIVKNVFNRWAKRCICPMDAMRCDCGNNHHIGKVITKKPITARDDEIKQNPRSRSAKMRIFEIDR